MVLGIYWYFGFPEGLYTFDFFKWKPGYGGHVGNPAELECLVAAPEPERLIQALRLLIDKFQDGFILVHRQENNLNIKTGAFNLHDYDFLLMQKVEEILKQEKVKAIPAMDRTNAEIIRIFNEKKDPPRYPRKNVLQMVSSGQHRSSAESAMLRMDCYVPAYQKAGFIAALAKAAAEENVNVLFYKEAAYNAGVNLMIFFSNGRQGMGLEKKQEIDAIALEEKAEAAVIHAGGSQKHQGGWDYYPQGEPVLVKMVDGEFIL